MMHPIGTPAMFGNIANPTKTGFVAEVKAGRPNVYTLSGGMIPETAQYVIAWDNGTFSDVGDQIAAPWFERARQHEVKPVSEAAALAMLDTAKAHQAEEQKRRDDERTAALQAEADFRDAHRDKIPGDAKAVIVARLEQDECDTMTDYFATSTKRTVILAFSRHNRDLFPEMRKAALRFEATKHLHDAPESAEHREKYSMGAGYYLKDGNRYNTGWKVEKVSMANHNGNNDPASRLPFGDWMVPEGQPFVTGAKSRPARSRTDTTGDAGDTLPAETINGCTITPATHTKKGFKMWIVQLADRVERDQFSALLSKARDAQGWYSRKWGTTPAGFAFKDADAARAFAKGVDARAPLQRREPRPRIS